MWAWGTSASTPSNHVMAASHPIASAMRRCRPRIDVHWSGRWTSRLTVSDHVPTTEEGHHLLEDLRIDDHCTDSSGTDHLVGGERGEVHADADKRGVRDRLSGVDEDAGTVRTSGLDQVLEGDFWCRGRSVWMMLISRTPSIATSRSVGSI